MLIVMLIVSLGSVMADTQVNTEINAQTNNGTIGIQQTYMSNDTITADVNAVTNGDLSLQTIFGDTENAFVNVGIDMNPYYDYTNTEEGISIKNFAHYMREGVQIIKNGEAFTGSKRPNNYIAMVLNDLAKIFATKNEVKSMYNNQMDIHYRLIAIERTLEKLHPDEYCESKLSVMRDYKLPGTECGDWQYTVSDGGNGEPEIIGIKNKELPEEEPTENESEVLVPNKTVEKSIPEPTISKDTIDQWQRMCDDGMLKWCNIIEQYKSQYIVE